VWYDPPAFDAFQEVLFMGNPEAEWEKQWSQINLRAWKDDTFKRRLIANPNDVLTEMGFSPPRGMQVKVVENTDSVVHLPLYAKPKSTELSEEDLKQVAGGVESTCSASYWGK
jgi:hypothetical protein